MKKLKVLTVVGTRPEIIRLSRVLAQLDRHCNHVLVHTGQNYDYELNQVFFDDLGIRKPEHFMNSAQGSSGAAHTIGNLIIAVDQVLAQEQPEAMLVLGDTNSCLSVIPAKRRKIPIFHMEAGNRCFDQQGTLHLARQAAAAGVLRFVFISSINVNGEATKSGMPFSADDAPAPQDPYGVSKMEAEQGLRQIAAETGMAVVIIRPPLVFGPGVKANFAALVRAVQRGWPLPLGAVHNQRSLVALDNLVDFIVTCLSHPQAANQTFLVSDGQNLSTAELVRGMAQAPGVPARLLPVPVWTLQAGAKLLGKGDAVQRLCGNLQVDIPKARSLLGWVPPVSVEEGLRRAVVSPC